MSTKLFNVKDGSKVIPVVFFNIEDATQTEAENYVKFVKSKVATPLEGVTVKACDDGKVDVEYVARGEKFERIRRITGYLVGTTERWNDSKKAEEKERVKHTSKRVVFNGDSMESL